MIEGLESYDWEEAFKYASGITREQVKRIVAKCEGENDGADWLGVFEIEDGRFLVLRASCDYTGWGCQESGESHFFDTDKAAVQSLGDADRNRLGLKMVY